MIQINRSAILECKACRYGRRQLITARLWNLAHGGGPAPYSFAG